jgi:hypothetical protein
MGTPAARLTDARFVPPGCDESVRSSYGFFIAVVDPAGRIGPSVMTELDRATRVPVRLANPCDTALAILEEPLLVLPFIDVSAEGFPLVEQATRRGGRSMPTVAFITQLEQVNPLVDFDSTRLLTLPVTGDHLRRALAWAGVQRWEAVLRVIEASGAGAQLPLAAARILLLTALDRRKSNKDFSLLLGREVRTIEADAREAVFWFRESYRGRSAGFTTRQDVVERLLRDATKL